MAKKVKKKMAEEEKIAKFSFPHFDVVGFIEHEMEQSYATLLSLACALALAVVSWRLTLAGEASSLPLLAYSLGALALGFGGAVGMVFLIRYFRPKSEEYRKGDWATLIMMYLFLWLGLWALLLNL
jgi:di/tricarboxylate transporter